MHWVSNGRIVILQFDCMLHDLALLKLHLALGPFKEGFKCSGDASGS